MGFDIHGVNGNYFRHTCWAWQPLWSSVSDICDLTQEQYNKGCYNGLFDEKFTKEESIMLYERIQEHLKNNKTELALNEFSNFCLNSGGFFIT